jgi:putative hemolysin
LAHAAHRTWHYGKAIHHWLSGSSLQRKNKLIAKHTFFSASVYKPELHELAEGGSAERRLDNGVVVAVLRAGRAAVLRRSSLRASDATGCSGAPGVGGWKPEAGG